MQTAEQPGLQHATPFTTHVLSARPAGHFPLRTIVQSACRLPALRICPTPCAHLRKRRLERGLLQKEAAAELGISEWGYANWENGKTTPGTVLYRRAIEFLGYYPHSRPTTLADRLRKIRRCLGLTGSQAARLAEVDEATFLMWERGKWRPTVRTRAKVERLFKRFENGLPNDCWDDDGG